jgi:uncharacterized protein (TIGR04255 family)
MGVAFDPVAGLSSYHSGALRERWKTEYPNVEHQPELAPTANLDEAPGAIMRVNRSPGIRLWFVSSDGAFLIQVQADRLVVNWRSTAEDTVYPRFPEVRRRFASAWDDLCQVLDVPPTVTQTEVTYVNLVARASREVLEGWVVSPLFDEDDRQQIVQTLARVQLRDVTSLAQRTTAVQSGPDSPTRLAFSVLADVTSQDEAMVAIDSSHAHIVERFRDVTTEEMHVEWGELA